MIRKFLKIVCVGVILSCMVACGGESSNTDTVEKLQEFTTLEKSEQKYLFNYNKEWTLTYNGEHDVKFVMIKEGEVGACFESILGEDCYPDQAVSEGGFIYDLGQNEIRIYFDVELEEGKLNYITYDMDKKEFILTVDVKNDYYASEELSDWIRECNLAAVMEEDVQEFKKVLEENGTSFDAIASLDFETIDKCIK